MAKKMQVSARPGRYKIVLGLNMFASLVGEGYERPNADAESTLDVNYAKVGEWLVRTY